MKCRIKAESKGRIRIHAEIGRMSLQEADVLEYYLRSVTGVSRVKIFDRTCDAIVQYSGSREDVVQALARFRFDDEYAKTLVPDQTSREAGRYYQDRLVHYIVRRYAKKWFLPHDIRLAITILHGLKYAKEGLKALANRNLNVAVLDATAIMTSIIRDDHDTASSVMFLLGIGDILEEWVRRKSINDLAGMMSLNVDKVWLCAEEGEVLVPASEISAGDMIVVRTGNLIPLDGKVISGEAMVNQASMTGESMPVRKTEGSYVYGGTVVEEGECRFVVDKASGSGRYDRIVKMIEESEKLKSETEAKAANLADKLVPYSLLGTGLSYALTQNAQTAMAFLMVDYSCALKLTMPLAVMSAMKESSRHSISVKGGKFLEAVAEADTIVFDKTGTLTYANPKVVKVIPFGGNEEDEMLRLAACLEEHYPHSIANAVVHEAQLRELHHEERHTTVEYVVAHGITSMIDGQKASIGSYHFIFEDERAEVAEEDRILFGSLPDEYSLLYLALDGKLAAVICISDPLRENAGDVIHKLHGAGFKNIVMMTGDSEKTAAYIAASAGVDYYIAEVLPEDKADYIHRQKQEGHKVIMIGDGVNDSPALSEADVGIAVNSGAAIAREIADITIEADDLEVLLMLRNIADALMDRIHRDYRVIIAFNTLLIALGATGRITPQTSAMLHNLSTLVISIYNMTDLLNKPAGLLEERNGEA
ncbi:MAG: heavy metal translocating P-type ATPase [Clostridiales bacterium]|nr:heavy metal translocating P-type ATPase [Clostridiales bacterium]